MNKFEDMLLVTSVVANGNFAKAANELGITPAMVGRRIAALEKTLGFILFNRTTRQMILTTGGRSYYEGCQQILAQVNELEESVTSAHHANPVGLIRLTAPDGLGYPFLIKAIKQFRLSYPDIRFDTILTNNTLDLAAEKIDLALRLAFEIEDSFMMATQIGETSFGLYASPDYLSERGIPSSLNDLKNHDCIHLKNSKYSGYWNVILEGNLVRYKQPWTLILPNTETVIHATSEGMGIAMIPTLFAKPFVDSNDLTIIKGVAEFPEIKVYASYPTRKHLPYRVKLFLDFLKDYSSDLL